MSNKRWVDELLPDQPQWVRDLVDDELRRREARLAKVERERDELKRLWFADASPAETEYCGEYVAFMTTADSATHRENERE